MTLLQFASATEHELERLRDELLSGTYRPRAARRILLPKPGGGHRTLAVSCVRDRVVQHALATSLSSRLDGLLHDSAYAYRRGRSAQQALAAVDAHLAEGLVWVVHADIEQFFDRIDPMLLLDALQAATQEPELVSLVETLLSAGLLVGGEIADSGMGTPQGSPLSPFLANLYLAPFDAAVAEHGFRMVRYADDLCLNTGSRAQAEAALELVRAQLLALRLQLNPRKVEIRHIGEGFVFLGFQFTIGGRRPGPKAARQLRDKLDAVLAARPNDGGEEADELLNGWLGYYGSLAGVDLPDSIAARAAALEARRVESKHVAAPPVDESATDAEAEVVRPVPTSRWGQAAIALASSSSGAEPERVAESLRRELAVEPASWPALAAALRDFDGAAAAEILASLGRFGDAAEATEISAPGPVSIPVPPRNEELRERPRLEAGASDAQHLLDAFGGAEHLFFRDERRDGKVRSERIRTALTVDHLRTHLAGEARVGVFPLRANNSVRCAAIRVLFSAKARKAVGPDTPLPAVVGFHARAIAQGLVETGLQPVVSLEPRRGFVVWLLFAEAIGAARARALLNRACERAGRVPQDVVREVVPAQDVAKPDKPGTGILLPLGIDPRSGERAWFCDSNLDPVIDQVAALRTLPLNGVAGVSDALSGQKAAAVDLDTSPLQTQPRAQAVYAGCNVFRHFVDKALRGEGLSNTERYFVADVLGRLGNEAEGALESVYRHLDDYRPGMAGRILTRLYPYPTSCGRIREKLPEVTARVGCDCRFRLVPGAYPTPALHAVGAAEIPGLGERVRQAAQRGGLARAAQAQMNEGRKDLGARAAALCARLADLRRQARAVERTVAAVEKQLDEICDEAGEELLETPAGSLRRVVVDNDRRRFVLEV